MGFDSEVMGSSINWSSSSMQHRSRGCTRIVLKEGEKKKLTLRLYEPYTSKLETSEPQKFVRSLASVCTMQNADKDERERKRKEREERQLWNWRLRKQQTHTNSRVRGTSLRRATGALSDKNMPRDVWVVHCAVAYQVFLFQTVLFWVEEGGVCLGFKVSRKVFKFKFRTSICHCKLV